MLSLTAPERTFFHRIPTEVKLGTLAVAVAALFVADSPWVLGGAFLLVVLAYLACGIRFARAGLSALRPIWVFVAILLIWHGVSGDIAQGVQLTLRLITAVGAATLVTMTTSLSEMRGLVDRLALPLERLGLPRGAAGMALALVIRFVPVLSDHATKLRQAWRARSPRRPNWRLAFPLALLALDDADRVSEAIRARGGLMTDRKD